MPTFLQPVALPERCFLEEVLYWVAFQRLPIIANFDNDGQDIRLSDEMGYAPDIAHTALTDEEAQRAGIPPDPNWRALIDGTTNLSSAHYDQFLAKEDLDPGLRKRWSVEREASIAFEKECALWHPYYERAIEYPCSRIFIALREGRLASKGRLLPALDEDEAVDELAKDEGILNIPPTDISPSFWTLKGIDFESSAAKNEVAHYCHISFLTDDVLRIFPGEREDVSGVERVGEILILNDGPSRYRSNSRRGRPPYPWDGFHIEVADLLQRNKMPAKKEAAIEHFQSWFEREHGIRPSRAAVGEKLKPYFDKFIRSARQKS